MKKENKNIMENQSHENNIININLEIDENENDNNWEIEYIDDTPVEEVYQKKERITFQNFVHSSDEENNDIEEEDDFRPNYFNHITHIDDDDISFKEINLNDDDMNPNHMSDMKKDLREDYLMFVQLVKTQNDVRTMMLKRVIKTYINKSSNRVPPTLIFGINKMADVLDLENMVGAILADILFDEDMIEQIKRYRGIILPFVSNSTSQENFLNQIVLILNKHNDLVEPDKIEELFGYIKHHLVNKYVFTNWYNSLMEPSDDTELSHLKSAIHCFTTHFL